MARIKEENPRTKKALANALIAMLVEGTPVHKIKVRDLTERCQVDRQTFYYYFKNVAEATQYAFRRETEAIFSNNGIEDASQLGWKARIEGILLPFEDNPQLRKSLLPVFADKALRKEMHRAIYQELETDFLPHLLATGVDESWAIDRTTYITYMLDSVLMGWLNDEIGAEVPDILNHIEEMLQDYVAGVGVRLS